MTTITSSSKRSGLLTVVRQDLRRVRLMSGLFLLLGFIALPLQLLMDLYQGPHMVSFNGESWQIYNSVSYLLFLLVVLASALVIGVQLIAYHFNKRAVDVYYALPATRAEMAGGHLLSGTIAVCLPAAANLLVTGVIAAVLEPRIDLSSLPSDLLYWSLIGFFVLLTVQMTGALMGTMADTVWGTLLLNFEPFLLLLAVINLFDAFVIGFDGSDFLNTVVRYIHPLPMLLSLIGNAKFELSIAACVFWLLLTAAMVALTIRFAVRRPAELAENTSVDNWYRLLLKVTSAYLIAYLFANMVFYSMASGTTPYFDSGEKGLYLAATAAGAALGFLVVEVVFGRGFKTLRGNWWIGLCDLVLSLAVTLLAITGLFGYETAVPNPAAVESATVTVSTGGYSYFYSGLTQRGFVVRDADSIERLTALHREVIVSADLQAEKETAALSPEENSFQVVYTLENGSTVTRRYYGLGLTGTALEDAVTLLSAPEVVDQVNPVLRIGLNDTAIQSITAMTPDGSTVELPDPQALLDTFQAELRADLTAGTAHQGEAVAYLNIWYTYPDRSANSIGHSDRFSESIQVPVYEGCESTVAALTAAGVPAAAPEAGDFAGALITYDHYDLYKDPSTGELLSGMAYYELYGEEGALTEAPSLTEEELALLLEVSHPVSSGLFRPQDDGVISTEGAGDAIVMTSLAYDDSTLILLLDTGERSANGYPLMVIRFLSTEEAEQLPAELIARLGIRFETAESGEGTDIYPVFSIEGYLREWPIA